MWWKPWPPMRKDGAILGTALCAGALGAVGSGVEGSCSAPRPGLSLSAPPGGVTQRCWAQGALPSGFACGRCDNTCLSLARLTGLRWTRGRPGVRFVLDGNPPWTTSLRKCSGAQIPVADIVGMWVRWWGCPRGPDVPLPHPTGSSVRLHGRVPVS